MKTLIAFSALAVSLSAAAAFQVSAQSDGQHMPMMEMMGGECPTMSMMGHGAMGRGGLNRGQPNKGRMGHGKMHRRHMGSNHMGAMSRGRLAYLESALNITADQESAWTAYSEAVNQRVTVMQGKRANMMENMHSGSAIERMDSRISGMEAMLAAMKAIKPATEELYAALSAEQKQIADQLIGGHCGGL